MLSTLFCASMPLAAAGLFYLPRVMLVVVTLISLIRRRKLRVTTLILLYVWYWIVQLLSFYSLGSESNYRAFLGYMLVSLMSIAILIALGCILDDKAPMKIAVSMALASIIIAISVASSIRNLICLGSSLEQIVQFRVIRTSLGRTNYLAAIQAMLAPYSICCIACRRSAIRRALGVVGLFSAVFVVLISTSRTGSFVLVFSVVLSVWVCIRAGVWGHRRRDIVRFVIGLMVATSTLLCITQLMPQATAKLEMRWSELGTLSGRTTLWEQTLGILDRSAWFMGIGVGQLVSGTWPHNVFLQVLLWTGIVGLMPFLTVVIWMLKGSTTIILRSKHPRGLAEMTYTRELTPVALASIAAAISVISGIIASLVEITIGTSGFDFFFAISAGVVEWACANAVPRDLPNKDIRDDASNANHASTFCQWHGDIGLFASRILYGGRHPSMSWEWCLRVKERFLDRMLEDRRKVKPTRLSMKRKR